MREICSVLHDYGPINIELYHYSEMIYDFLNRDKINELDRLKKINHLGLISEFYEGVRHSKWDYIIIQLYLSQLLRKYGKITGLASNIKLSGGKEISVIDLINSWSFLLNIGHLQRTFAAERLWFDEVLNNKIIRDYIKLKLERKPFQKKFKELIENEDYYGFYEIISVLYIKEILLKKSKQISNDMLDIFEIFYKKDKRISVNKAKTIFKRIRYLSFVYLDTNNSHSCINIHTTLFFNHMKQNVNDIIAKEDNELRVVFSDIERILFNTVYSSTDYKEYLANYYKKRKKQLNQKIKLKDSEIKKGHNFEQKFIRLLLSAREHDIALRFATDEWKHIVRFNLRSDYIGRDVCKYCKEEIELNDIENKYFLVESVKADDLETSIIDVFSNNGLNQKDVCIIANKIKNYINKYYSINYYEHYPLEIDSALEDLFIFSFKSLLNKNFNIHFTHNTPLVYTNFSYIQTKSKTKSIIRNLIKDTKNEDIEKERKHELLCLLNVIRDINLNGTTIISLRNVEINDDNLKSIAEFDGVGINLSKNIIKVILVEAKSGKDSSNVALNDLKKKMEKLDINKYKIPNRTRKRKNGYAYSILKLG